MNSLTIEDSLLLEEWRNLLIYYSIGASGNLAYGSLTTEVFNVKSGETVEGSTARSGD